MKKRLIMVLMAGVMTLTSAIPAFAAPKQMADGKIFDAEYYAANNQDVVNVLGTDENLLYSHYMNNGKAEGRLPYDENQLDFTTKAMQKLSFEPRDLIFVDEKVTINELRADIRPHANSYQVERVIRPDEEEWACSEERVHGIDIYDIPMANYIYCCEFDKYVAEKALLGWTLDNRNITLSIGYRHDVSEVVNAYTSKLSMQEYAGYDIWGSLTFTTKEGLKLNRSLSLVNSSSDDLTISKAKGGEREVTVYVNEKADDGKLILDTCYHMSYPEFYQLYMEGKVQMYSGEAYGIRRADIGTCREQYYTFEAVNKPVYVN